MNYKDKYPLTYQRAIDKKKASLRKQQEARERLLKKANSRYEKRDNERIETAMANSKKKVLTAKKGLAYHTGI